MKKFIALPTWLSYCLVVLMVPRTHPLHRQWRTLSNWYKGQTELCKQFDILLWIGSPGFFIGVYFFIKDLT